MCRGISMTVGSARARGSSFQLQSSEILGQHFGVNFRLEHPIPIGTPPKVHRFDLVSADLQYVGECKSYTWTSGDNSPSAKLGHVNEAVFYLSFLPAEYSRFVVMQRDVHPKRLESLADDYYRKHQHLLNGVFLIEIDLASKHVREIGRKAPKLLKYKP